MTLEPLDVEATARLHCSIGQMSLGLHHRNSVLEVVVDGFQEPDVVDLLLPLHFLRAGVV